ncbi:uncharacterized protein BX664DRAFT_49391 [Halteromyces radiatus]|uniref:uncharacterized protein n=1 Tax=Halteromyces radiatus TaxID=101107 RepID=UPI00221F23DD|nr:uncharacterized protein BX664DRAFT_49391 [Halteromyces radiatus]KAI8076905.1 hypothetical protein BX664DRAFT_49391 [Halteromyces radiatus]
MGLFNLKKRLKTQKISSNIYTNEHHDLSNQVNRIEDIDFRASLLEDILKELPSFTRQQYYDHQQDNDDDSREQKKTPAVVASEHEPNVNQEHSPSVDAGPTSLSHSLSAPFSPSSSLSNEEYNHQPSSPSLPPLYELFGKHRHHNEIQDKKEKKKEVIQMNRSSPPSVSVLNQPARSSYRSLIVDTGLHQRPTFEEKIHQGKENVKMNKDHDHPTVIETNEGLPTATLSRFSFPDRLKNELRLIKSRKTSHSMPDISIIRHNWTSKTTNSNNNDDDGDDQYCHHQHHHYHPCSSHFNSPQNNINLQSCMYHYNQHQHHHHYYYYHQHQQHSTSSFIIHHHHHHHH